MCVCLLDCMGVFRPTSPSRSAGCLRFDLRAIRTWLVVRDDVVIITMVKSAQVDGAQGVSSVVIIWLPGLSDGCTRRRQNSVTILARPCQRSAYSTSQWSTFFGEQMPVGVVNKRKLRGQSKGRFPCEAYADWGKTSHNFLEAPALTRRWICEHVALHNPNIVFHQNCCRKLA